MKPRLAISFSGGRTSAYMTKRLLDEIDRKAVDVIVIFANTGEEDEGTLQFVQKCDMEFGFNTVWIEALVNPIKGVGTSHKVVDFNSASRIGSEGGPFEQMVRKYGIPNPAYPHCTRELKQVPIRSFLRSIGWNANTYNMAIGIRSDEVDRISPKASAEGIIYPLVKWKVTKSDVLKFWKSQSFDLNVPEHRGNCVWCWKKTLRKHMTLALQDPSVFNTPFKLEGKYAFAGSGSTGAPRRFFRGNMTTSDIIHMAKTKSFHVFIDDNYSPELDVGNGCGESCEVFSDLESASLNEVAWHDLLWALLA
jgi:hypothetical protein